jgi:hypothetical protein
LLPLAPINLPIDCILADEPQLSLLTKNGGAIAVEAMLARILLEVSDLVSCNWSASAIALYAATMRQNFWHLRFDEIAYVLNRGVNGGYGKIYGSLSYAMIGDWLNTYIDGDRMQAVEMARMKKISAAQVEQTQSMGVVVVPSEEDAAEGFVPMSMLDIWKEHRDRIETEMREERIEGGKPTGNEDTHEKMMDYLRENLSRFTDAQLSEYAKQFSKTRYVLEKGNSVPVERMLFPDAHQIVHEEIERRAKQ